MGQTAGMDVGCEEHESSKSPQRKVYIQFRVLRHNKTNNERYYTEEVKKT
jgi:hypothetical protein